MRCEIKIVQSIRKYNRDLHARIRKGALARPERGIVMTPETFSSVFSPERIKLLQRVHRNDIQSIYQLAKELGKPYEVVFRNIKYLEGIGLLKIVEREHRRVPQIARRLSIDLFAGVEV